MNPDEKLKDPTKKETQEETQEFDPALLDEEGIDPERTQEGEEDRDQSESWHPFKTQ